MTAHYNALRQVVTVICDNCGETEEFQGDDFRDAMASAKANEWSSKKEGSMWINNCPECK